MAPIKLLHTADLHLDSPLRSLALRHEGLRDWVATASRGALMRIADIAVEEGVRALLIAGDLFDGAQRSARTAAFVLQVFDRLRAAGIDVFLIRGNHDHENGLAGDLAYPANVHIFDGRGGKHRIEGTDVWIHGVSFRDRHAPDSLLPRFAAPVPGAVNIGLMHTSLAGAPGHDAYAPCRVSDLAAHGFDYWALGHVHGRTVHSERPWIVMPGTPQGRDIGEPGPKSASLVTVAEDGLIVEEVPTAEVVFQSSTCDMSDAGDSETAREILRRHLRDQAATLGAPRAILRLGLTGATPLAWQMRRDADVWRQVADDLAEDTGTLWIEQLDLDLALPGSAAAQGAVAELAELMATIRAEPSFAAEAEALVADVLGTLPPSGRAQRLPDEEARRTLADALAQEGAAAILARLGGAGS